MQDSRLNRFLFTRIDNGSLIVFRIIFGFLVLAETWGAILTGWVDRVMIEPQFTFNFIGFDFLQPLPGYGMYGYFLAMGICGIGIMLGYRYKLSMVLFTLLWTGVYLMQKSAYNNHYYLLVLLSFIMIWLPANTYASLDAKRNTKLLKLTMPSWCKWILVLQMAIAYTYGSIAKLYPDWLSGLFIKNAFSSFADTPIIGDFFQEHIFHLFISYSGILFDLLIIPLLLWKPSRKLAFAGALFFHLFNAAVFQIGIFPFLSLAFTLFFFDPKIVNRIFLRNKETITPSFNSEINEQSTIKLAIGLYLLIQLILPIRHHFIPSNVFWTEEGHRMSWRMMLRSKSGYVRFTVKNLESGEVIAVRLSDYLSDKQQRKLPVHPDMIWQLAQRLKNEHAAKGETVQVFADARVSLNGRPYSQYTDPEIDLAQEEWPTFEHKTWLKPFPGW